MNATPMTSAERVMTALGHREPDRVPFLLPATMHGAREVGLSLREYFSKAENVMEGQLRLRRKYRHDALVGFMYAGVEFEAFGGEVIFREDGPPNSGEPFITSPDQVLALQPPCIKDCPSLQKILRLIRLLSEKAGGSVPVMAAVVSPFSLPVMQMGFERYIEIMYERPDIFEALMRINEEFCVAFANAQLEAGAGAISYADPVSSPTIIPVEMYRRTGWLIAKRTFARIKGPVAIGFASGRTQAILDDVAATGAVGVGVSVDDDLAEAKASCRGRMTVMGNLNAIEMRRWSQAEAEEAVKTAIAKAGRGGGYLLTDNHGEIPFQVPEDVLMAVSEAVHKWGQYPLTWVGESGNE